MKNFADIHAQPIFAPPVAEALLERSARTVSITERLTSLILIALLYGVCCILFRDIVAPVYFFGGFVYDPSSSFVFPHILLLIAALFTRIRPQKMVDVFVLLSVIFILVPATALTFLQSSDKYFLLTMYLSVFSINILAPMLEKSMPRKRVSQKFGMKYHVNFYGIYFFTLSILLYLIIHVDGFFNISFLNVYDYRLDFNESLEFPLNYLLPIAAGACSGFITAVALDQRRWIIAFSAVVIGVLFFGFSSHKAFLFYPLFAAVGYFVIRMRYGGAFLISGITFLGLLTIFSSGFVANILSSSFANRLIFIPAQIHFFFFDEFSHIGAQFWAESKFSLGLIKTNLSTPAVFYIGEKMTGLTDVGANTGWIANGYMNAGYFGIAFYAVLLSGIIAAIDWLGSIYGRAFVVSAFIIPIFSVINSIDLLAGLLTGGLMAVFVIFFAFLRPATQPLRVRL